MEYETQEIIYEGLEDSEGVNNSRDAKGNILKYYLNNFKRRWYVILICTILGFAPAYIWSRREQTYYTGNFEVVYDLVENGCRGLLAFLRQELKEEIGD